MTDLKSNAKSVVDLVFATTLRFPVPEVLLVTFLGVAFVQMLLSSNIGMFFVLGPGWDSSTWLEALNYIIDHAAITVFASPLMTSAYLVLFIVPMVVSLEIGEGFENGYFRTILSYPIRRRTYLLATGGITIILVGAVASFSLLLAVSSLFPQPIDFGMISILIASLWVYVLMVGSASLLVSILLRTARTSLFASVGIWAFAFVTGFLPGIPTLLVGVLNPVLVSMSFAAGGPAAQVLGTVTMGDVVLSIVGAAALGIIMFLASLIMMERVEI